MPAKDFLRIREAFPSFEPASVLEDDDHVRLQTELASHVAKRAAWEYPEEIVAMFDLMEELYAQAEVTNDTELANTLTVGFLETLLMATEKVGLDFRKLSQAIRGERTRDGWETALEYVKPGFDWDDEKGLVAREPLPIPIGTVRVHRGWQDRESRHFVIELQRISGDLRTGDLLRYRISGGHYFTAKMAAVKLRSSDVPDEYEVRVAVATDHQFEAWEFWLRMPHRDFWQIARETPSPI